MAICDDIRADRCRNACCYIADKDITELEAERLGSKGAVKKEGEWFLRNDPNTGACVYLNIEEGGCGIYNNRLEVCKRYSCVTDGNRIERIIEYLKKVDLERRIDMITDFRREAAEQYPDLDPQEAFEVMYPDLT